MAVAFRDDWLTIHGGDCRAVLRDLEPESVHCVVTSPPYWGLRDYGTATWDGGDPEHEHVGAVELAGAPGSEKQASKRGSTNVRRGDCDCVARRIDSQLGLEPTPEEYVAAMVDVFREVRRVLRNDGTLWLNLGDSYAPTGGIRQPNTFKLGESHEERKSGFRQLSPVLGLKPKDLVGIPWRVAFALQADGWYLRSDIIWSKPNPMPESVTDRPTKAHEYLFLLSKSARYFYRNVDANPTPGLPPGATPHTGLHLAATPDASLTSRNLRSVWTIATAPYPGAHFATFPPKLVEPCVKAGCPEGGLVLDPFAGTGTVGMVAQSLSRRAVLIDLNPDYLRQCLARNAQTPLGLSL